jgi:hypothetical protein
MMMSEPLDNYGERAGKCEYLTLAFSPTSAPLRSRWRNNGLSADFLGDYVTTFLPANGTLPAFKRRQNEVKHAVTYIANELLENAMKYHQPDVEIPIRIHLSVSSRRAVTKRSLNISGRETWTIFSCGNRKKAPGPPSRPCPAWAC